MRLYNSGDRHALPLPLPLPVPFGSSHEQAPSHSHHADGVLGLYSAHLCGVEISPTVWFAISKHVLMDQRRVDAPKIRLTLTTQRKDKKHRVAESGGQRGTRAVSSRRLVEPWGWAYQGPLNGGKNLVRPMTGSMTVAGLTNLTICEAVLRGARKGGGETDSLDRGQRISSRTTTSASCSTW